MQKIIAAQAAKNEALIDKFDIKAIREFIESEIVHLPETYSTSGLNELRCLLHSIFISGFSWNYPGYSNDPISPIYKELLDADKQGVYISSEEWRKLEPTLYILRIAILHNSLIFYIVKQL